MLHRLAFWMFVVSCPAVAVAHGADLRDPGLRFGAAVALLDAQRDDAALEAFTAMTQDFPELPDPWNNIALLHARAGRLEQARQALEAALRNDPGHRGARANLGQVHLMLAVQAWQSAASAAPAGMADPSLLRKLQLARRLLDEPGR